MRIALVVHQFPPEHIGGTEIYTWSLGRALARLGHQVHIFHPQQPGLSEPASQEQDGMHIWRAQRGKEGLAGPAQRFWHTFRSGALERDFAAFLAQVQPDIVHFQHLQRVSIRLISLAASLPRVLTLHDYWYFCPNSQLIRPDHRICSGPRRGWRCAECGLDKLQSRSLKLISKLAALPFAYRYHHVLEELRTIEQFIAPSAFVKEQYLRQRVPAERIRVIGHGLDRERLTASVAQTRRQTTGTHFGYLGSIAWQKGVHVLVKAFRDMPAAASLTIYGDTTIFPEYARHLQSMAQQGRRIRFAGPLDYRHVGAALGELDYLVVPSLWHETFCLVIQEANALGVPAVASRLGALTERVQDGKTGRLFTPGSTSELRSILLTLIAHPELKDSYRANMRPTPTMAQHASILVELYEEMRANKRKG